MKKIKQIKINKDKKILNFNLNLLDINEELSYSRIDCFKSCGYKYKLKYIDKKFTNDTSIALQIGSILHKGLELKYSTNMKPEEIIKVVYDGYSDDNENIIGINRLKENYPFDWEEKDKNGRTYDEKIELYKKRIYEDIDSEWECIGCEVEFHILFENKVVIKGFIDRVDKNKTTGAIRVVDYKSSVSEYSKKDLATPMQMFIYALACKDMYGQLPEEFVYDMILIGVKQNAMTKGWESRGIKSLSKKIDSLIEHNKEGNYRMKPSPSPLCHWCSYSQTNPNATDGKDLCEYYSLWTKENKTFKTNKQWIEPVIEDDGWDDFWE